MSPIAVRYRLLTAAFLSVVASSSLPCAAIAQETVTISRQKLDELTARAQEVDRLTAEVAELKARLKRLEDSTTAPAVATEPVLTPGLKPLPQPSATAPTVRAPLPDPAQWPPFNEKSIIPITELLAHYSANPVAADARYKGRHLKIRGAITAFDKPMFLSYYHVVFRDPALSVRALARIYPPEQFKRVYVTGTGDQMVGEAPRLAATVLAKAGSEVVIDGKCAGVRNGIITFVEAAFVTDAGSAPLK